MNFISGFGTMQSRYKDGVGDSVLCVQRLRGYNERHNDVLYAPKLVACDKDDVVVFFGGDVQDFVENMKMNSENKKYTKWSLENVVVLLRHKFRDRHVVVIRPSRFDSGTFSCYDNFVSSGKYGVPEFRSYNNALLHLKKLLHHLPSKLTSLLEQRDSKMESALDAVCSFSSHSVQEISNCDLNFEQAMISLIGFSKGCVVLNQFIHEFHFIRTNNICGEETDFIARIKDMHLLDGGHAGRKTTWITDLPTLQTFSTLGINIHVHVTPYQVKDKRRPWIGKEEKIFTETLYGLKSKINRQLHFENKVASLDQHFEVLSVFV